MWVTCLKVVSALPRGIVPDRGSALVFDPDKLDIQRQQDLESPWYVGVCAVGPTSALVWLLPVPLATHAQCAGSSAANDKDCQCDCPGRLFTCTFTVSSVLAAS